MEKDCNCRDWAGNLNEMVGDHWPSCASLSERFSAETYRPAVVLSHTLHVKELLEEALASAVTIIEMAKEVDREEWGKEVWDENAESKIETLEALLEELRNTGDVW